MTDRLTLGSAQFGAPYGLTNSIGQLGDESVQSIVAEAWNSGWRTLDTAPAYGNSQIRLGGLVDLSGWRVITKLSRLSPATPLRDAERHLQSELHQSLTDLGIDHFHGLLAHDPDAFVGPHARAYQKVLTSALDQRITDRIGISAYEDSQVAIAARYIPALGIIEIPVNVINPDMASSAAVLAAWARGASVYARSVFLQGALLAATANLPAALEPIQDRMIHFQESCTRAGYTFVEGALGFVMTQAYVSRAVVGLTTTEELTEVETARGRSVALNWSEFRSDSPMRDPRNWP